MRGSSLGVSHDYLDMVKQLTARGMQLRSKVTCMHVMLVCP